MHVKTCATPSTKAAGAIKPKTCVTPARMSATRVKMFVTGAKIAGIGVKTVGIADTKEPARAWASLRGRAQVLRQERFHLTQHLDARRRI